MSDAFSQTLGEDHKRCDRLLALTERATEDGDWTLIGNEAILFRDSMEAHFQFEESVLFPSLEAQVPMASGPTGVMRMEHAQMRRMLEELIDAVSDQSADDSRGILETLHLLTQQHNAKEEAILYPMADHALASQAETLLARFAHNDS